MTEKNHNIALNRQEVLRKTVLHSKPRMLFLLLTSKCNLRCIMCNTVQENSQTLPYAAFDKLGAVLPFIEIIDWQGGEVFTVDYFRKLFQDMISAYPHIRHRFTTNGLLLDGGWIDLLSKANTEFIFSIDTVVPETYEKIRKNARFKDLVNILENIKNSRNKNSGFQMSMTSVVMRSNFRELHMLADFAARFSFMSIRLDFIRAGIIPEEDIFGDDNSVEKEILVREVAVLREKCSDLGVEFECTFEKMLPIRDKGGNGAVHVQNSDIQDSSKCLLPWQRIFIDYKGDVRPDCLCRADLAVGNILRDDFDDVWNGPRMQEYRRRIMKDDTEGFCRDDCVYRNIGKWQFTGGL